MSATAQAGAESAATVWLRANARQLAFGLRLTASVCLALYVAFALQVEDPSWAGTSAAITCQPVLGAALRKGQFRFLGTVVGAVFVVLLSAAFPQERIGFLGGLVAWAGLCCFAASLLTFTSVAVARPRSNATIPCTVTPVGASSPVACPQNL